jgi:SNF family Na+-dependent transporter
MQNNRENWGSKIGVILAVAGSAVGLGNFLRFPVQAATNGGGAFIIPYLIAFLLLGIPLAWMEWTLGRYAGRHNYGTAPSTLHIIFDKKKPWAKHLGSIGLLPPLFIVFYYVFIQSWILAFAYYSLTGKLMEVTAQGSAAVTQFFGDFIMLKTCVGPVPAAIIFFLITFACNMTVLALGVRKGIERVNKICMPILLFLGIVLVIRVLTLPNIGKGLAFMWNPNFSELANPKVWMAAAGQVFFTMSLGMGIIWCYASYLKPKEDLVLSSLTASATNGLAEIIIGGTVVIPIAVIIAGANIEECAKLGTFGLGFQTMPYVFGTLPLGGALQALWFALLFFAGITSAISIIQPLISFCEDDLKFTRKKSVTTISIIIFIGSLTAIFGLGAGTVDELDFWGGTFLLVVFGAIQAIIFSFVLGRRKSQIVQPGESVAFALMNEGSQLKLPRFFRPIIQYVCPAYLIILLVSFTFTDGLPLITLSNIPADAKVTFLGGEFSKLHFTWAFRGFMLLLVVLLNIAIAYAWRKGGTAEMGRDTSIHKMPLGKSDEYINRLANKKKKEK